MTDEFDISLNYKGQDMHFPAQLLPQGYTHKFKVIVDGTEIFFEPDEEGCYRAVKMSWQQIQDLEKIDKGLLSAIAKQIEIILA